MSTQRGKMIFYFYINFLCEATDIRLSTSQKNRVTNVYKHYCFMGFKIIEEFFVNYLLLKIAFLRKKGKIQKFLKLQQTTKLQIKFD
jgi:hypothetical protein